MDKNDYQLQNSQTIVNEENKEYIFIFRKVLNYVNYRV